MKRGIVTHLAVALFACVLICSCEKEQIIKPETDLRIDAIVYMGQWDNTTAAACIMLPNLTKKTVFYVDLERVAMDSPRTPMITTDGGKIVICNDISLANNQSSLLIWDPEKMKLSGLPGFESDNVAYPVVTPDSTRIVYVNLSTSSIEVVNMDGSGRYVVCPGGASAPSVTPDGKKIIFQRTESGISNIYAVGIAGDNLAKITNGNAAALYTDPRVTPNGKIVYVKTNGTLATNENSAVCISNLDGMNEIELVPDGKYKFPSTNKAVNQLLYWNETKSAWVLAGIDAVNKVSTIYTINGSIDNSMFFCRVLPQYVSGNPAPQD